MTRETGLGALFDQLGREVDRDLIEAALTHRGATGPARPHNERLEFLGDRVLNLVIAEAVMRRWPDDDEGRLAPRYNALVRKEVCAEVAADIGLGAHLRLERSNALTGGRKRTSTLADAMEAVIAAVYLDAGFEAARELVLRLWGGRIDRQAAEAPRDPKSLLQEWAEGRGMAKPEYVLIAREGPDHAPRFEIEARVADGRSSRAEASSKREAEKAAAAALLKRIGDGRS
jgi:ribonuclease-3